MWTAVSAHASRDADADRGADGKCHATPERTDANADAAGNGDVNAGAVLALVLMHAVMLALMPMRSRW